MAVVSTFGIRRACSLKMLSILYLRYVSIGALIGRRARYH
jgi:hypothetical protein